MTTQSPTNTNKIRVYPPDAQGTGAFDGGKITEIKPIPFPHESGGSDAIGPLLYWAWASAHGDGIIPMHPHKGFEIVSYVLAGELGHSDTLGTKSRVGEGGAQVMQTGSGVSHQEEMYGERTDFFQIWFEPNLKEAMKRPPTYAEYQSNDFPVSAGGVKSVIGGRDAPIQLVTDAKMIDVTIKQEQEFSFAIESRRYLAVVVVEGSGTWNASDDASPGGIAVSTKDFTVLEGVVNPVFAAGVDGARLVAIDIPMAVDYPLYGR